MRATQALFPAQAVDLQCFVDDPCITLTGTRADRDRWLALIILVWRALGLPLAFRKGQRGSQVTWIGSVLTCIRDEIRCTIKDSILEDLRA